jgi:signal transduction histidine kinase
VVVRVEERGPNVRLWIDDNGIGIAEDARKHLYGLFHRLTSSAEYPGTGVGLAIVKRAVERMNGSTGLESVPDEGSHFWIELPRG